MAESAEGCTPMNLLHGVLTRDKINEICSRRNPAFEPSKDQLEVFKRINETEKHVIVLNSLAGTGKTSAVSILLEALLEKIADKPGRPVILMLQPSRQLRNDAVQETLDFLAKEDVTQKVFWLGRASAQGSLEEWEAKLEEEVNNAMKDELSILEEKAKLVDDAYRTLENKRLHWSEVCEYAACENPPPEMDRPPPGEKGNLLAVDRECAEDDLQRYVPWEELTAFMNAVDDHQRYVYHLIDVREIRIEELTANIQFIVSTVDAWCKFKSNLVKGLSGRVLKGLQVHAAVVDEYEALEAPQAMGAFLDLPYCAMIIYAGDIFQRFSETRSRFVKMPWTDMSGIGAPASGARGPGTIDEEEGTFIPEDAWFPGQGPDTDGADRKRVLKCTKPIPHHTLLHGDTVKEYELYQSKRFGKNL